MRGRAFVGWVRWFLLVTGVLALTYVSVTLLRATLYQKAAAATLEEQVSSQEQRRVSQTPALAVTREGDVLGRIEIPRLGVRVAILEGTSSRTLRLGVGHITGTALPGSAGNIGIAGHRDTYFRALKDARANDEIQIQTAAGVSLYKVDWVKVVAPGDTEVLASSTESALTLVTCYPFYYIGASPKRFVVHAQRIEQE
jgi:sortase A